MTGARLSCGTTVQRAVRGKDLHDMMPEKAEDKLPMR